MNTEESKSTNDDNDLNLTLFDYFYEIPGYSEQENFHGPRVKTQQNESSDKNFLKNQTFVEQIDKEAERYYLKCKHHEERQIKKGVKRIDDKLLIIRDVFNITGTASSILALIKSCRPIIVRWLKNREGRYIIIKAKNHEITINKKKDIKKAVNELKELQNNRQHLMIENSKK